jgi:hypothetical protein
MPVEHSCRFDQNHGVEDLRPDSVKPNPEQPVGGEEPRLSGTLPTQDGHLMSQGDEFDLQRGAAPYPEREHGTDGGQKRVHADDGMATTHKSLHLLALLEF